jgi:hypothetical protein
MNPTVRVEAGYYLIDTDAWIRQRVGDRDTENTALLREFISHEAFGDQSHRMDVATRVVLWCAARGWLTHEGAPIEHDHPQLTEPVNVVLATLPQPDRRAVAIVIDDGGEPVVYPDLTTDEGCWYQVATVDIVCPTGHRMTWDGAHGLIDHEGADTTITAVFGTDRHAPFQPCRLCAAYADTDSGEGCDCGGWAIYCRVCGARTTLALPDIPTHHPDHGPLST